MDTGRDMVQPESKALPMAIRRTAARYQPYFPPEVIGADPADRDRGSLRDPGLGRQARPAHLRRPAVPATASLTRYPLEGYREKCDTSTVLGTRYASKPLELAIPITIAGMSFGALSAHRQRGAGPGGQRGGDVHHHR